MSKAKRFSMAILMMLVLLVLTSCGGPEHTYKQAQELLSKGEYSAAAEKFASIPEYEDAPTMAKYSQACALCEAGDYEKGIAALEALGDFEGCAERIEYYSALAGPEFNYKKAQALLSQGKYTEAAAKFETLGSYEDAATLTMYCKACALCESGNFEAGIAGFKSLGNYKDCSLRISYYTARSWDDNSVGTTEYEWMERAKSIYNENPLYLDSAERITALDARIETAKKTLYDDAVAAAEQGQYSTAIATFKRLGNYKDSAKRVTYYGIRADEDALAGTTDETAYDAIVARYTNMGIYLDCADRAAAMTDRAETIRQDKYNAAVTAGEQGQYDTAIAAFKGLGDYSDSKQRVTYYGIRKDEAAAVANSNFGAMQTVDGRYDAMGDYLDCADRSAAMITVLDGEYDKAVAWWNEGKYDDAIVAFTKLSGYKDSKAQITACKYDKAVVLGEQGQYDTAIAAFKGLGDYSDSKQRVTYYGIRKDEAALANSTNESACDSVAAEYTAMGNYLDCADRAAAMTDRAETIRQDKYNAAVTAGEQGQYDTAMAAFKGLGDYSDSKQRVTYYGIRKNEATLANSTKESAYDSVAAEYIAMGNYLDCADRAAAMTDRAETIRQDKYNAAVIAGEQGQYDTAMAAFKGLGDYSDSKQRVTYYGIRKDEATAVAKNDFGAMLVVSTRYAEMGEYLDCADRSAAMIAILDSEYEQAKTAGEQCEYDTAIAAFKKLDNYRDSRQRAAYYGIRKDEAALAGSTDESAYDKVALRYVQMGEYLDCTDRAAAVSAKAETVRQDKYDTAVTLKNEGKYWDAITAFMRLGNYKDSADRVDEVRAEMAVHDVISAGWQHTVGLKADGRVVAVSDISDTQCNVSGWTDIVAISAGYKHTVGLKADGTVVAVGDNSDKQCNVSGWTDIVAISAGSYHTVGLKADGTVVAVGYYGNGRCNVGGWTDIVAISAGYFHTVGLKADGTVVAVGDNSDTQCNVSGWTDIVAISAGERHTVGLKADGTVVAVGSNSLKQCDVSGWTDIVAISAGERHTVGLKADGTVVAVGYNGNGGRNVSGWTDIVAISAGSYHTVGLKADGTVVAVGNDGNGRCNVGGWKLRQIPRPTMKK